MITVDEAFACAGERVWRPDVEVVALSDLDDDERVKFDYLDATIEAGIYSTFSNGRVGMFDMKIPTDFASLKIINALIHHYEAEGRWMIGIFAAETSGDVINTFQIVFAPSLSERLPPAVRGDERAVARILGSRNRAGLARDIAVLRGRLEEAGFGVEVSDPDQVLSHRVSVQFHLENVAPDALGFADRNIAIPNPEMWVSGFSGVEVWTKTPHATGVFEGLGAKVRYVGWSSVDRMDSSAPRERVFLHVCGSSHRKGTDVLVRAWRPEWPTLTVVAQPAPWWKDLHECEWFDEPRVPNVRIVRGHLSDDHLRELQNRSLFHIYPSLYEGYGHALWEALSCGAIVGVPDGEPFSGMSGAFHAIPSVEGKPASNGLVHDREVGVGGIARIVEQMLWFGSDEIEALGKAARDSWAKSNAAFRSRFTEALGVAS